MKISMRYRKFKLKYFRAKKKHIQTILIFPYFPRVSRISYVSTYTFIWKEVLLACLWYITVIYIYNTSTKKPPFKQCAAYSKRYARRIYTRKVYILFIVLFSVIFLSIIFHFAFPHESK